MLQIKPILKDKEEFPTIETLANYLSSQDLKLYQQFLAEIHERSFKEDWNYYNDGKNWLAKILSKKRNLGWLSIWETGFKLTVYFGERLWAIFSDSELSEELQKYTVEIHQNGKLIAVMLLISDSASLQMGLNLITFKKKVK